MAKILILYYSAYGHVFDMARSAAAGASEVEGAEVRIVRIPEMESERNRTPYQDKFKKREESALSGKFRTVARFAKYEASLEAQKDVPLAANEDLRWADGVIWGFPTYYGSMPSQVKLFLEFAGELCADGSLEGKPAGLITSAGSIHTGHEATLLTSMVPLFHFGMLIVGLPYSENPEYLTAEAIGGSPYGASVLAGPDSSRSPDDRELLMASRLGRRVSAVAAALVKDGFGRSKPD